ncbi:Hypothetical predicted protein [Cloeon dipterum]|uniref:Receptor L-domain domain-containing protein n=1 Tax=Cloeon dipterum TaxID=197152 RepID=A0A8S1DIR5_9INSE|nr:Hypothetical predicted protein [Cloeon dipterum]
MTGRPMADDDEEHGRPPGRPQPAPTVLVAAVLLLLVGHAAAQLTPNADIAPNRNQGICKRGFDLRNNAQNFERLRGCRVIEGSVQIVLIAEDLNKLTFPELREITGYLLLYRVSGLRSLAHLFPNLSVIRGKSLLHNFALILYENFNLQEVGLHSLTHILRGYVRIEKNPALCYVDTIDWDFIARAENPEHKIKNNKKRNECPGCPEKGCPVSPQKNEPLCWNKQHCQKGESKI